MSIEIYTKNYCPYCHMAKDLLRQKKADYNEIAIDGDAELREQMIERAGRQTVPQIFINDEHVGGFDDLAALERAGLLDDMLQQAADTDNQKPQD